VGDYSSGDVKAKFGNGPAVTQDDIRKLPS